MSISYDDLFLGFEPVDTLDDDTIESLKNSVYEMYELLKYECHKRVVNAYEHYRDEWTYNYIPQHIQDETLEKYRHSEESDYWTFREYLDKYGYTNGLTPISFFEWYDDVYKGDLTFAYDIEEDLNHE